MLEIKFGFIQEFEEQNSDLCDSKSINHQCKEIFHRILGFGYTMRIFFLLTEEGLKIFWIRDSQKFRSKSCDIHGWRKNLISDTKS